MTHESGTLQPDGVRTMFDRIAPVYDVMNRVMTVGLDRRWRRLTVEAVVPTGACTETFARPPLEQAPTASANTAIYTPGANARLITSPV